MPARKETPASSRRFFAWPRRPNSDAASATAPISNQLNWRMLRLRVTL